MIPDEQTDDESPEPSKGMSFIRINELLYFVGNDDKQRLCVSKSMKKKIFRLGHDDRSHAGFHQCYEHISEVIYIRKLMRHLQKYIEYCLTCQVCQTKRHQTYRSLNSIQTPSICRHTIIIDFIMALPPSTEGYNCTLIITDKFIKRITIMSEKDT